MRRHMTFCKGAIMTTITSIEKGSLSKRLSTLVLSIAAAIATALFAILVSAALPTSHAYAEPDRTPIDTIEGTCQDLEGICGYGQSVTQPTFTTEAGDPAVLVSDAMSHWQKLDTGTGAWEDYENANFGEGTYRFKVLARIDVDGAQTYMFSDSVALTVNGKSWSLDTSDGPAVINNYDEEDSSQCWSNAWFVSPSIDVTKPTVSRTKISLIKATTTTPLNEVCTSDAPTGLLTFTVTDGDMVKVSGDESATGWYHATTGESWELMDSTGSFVLGDEYYYQVTFMLDMEGSIYHYFADEDDISLVVNGEEWDAKSVINEEDACYATFVSPSYTCLLGTIDSITITGVAQPVVGTAPSVAGIQTSTAGVSIDWNETAWCYAPSGTFIPYEGTSFASGQTYYIRVAIMPDAGYAIDGNVTATINGKSVSGVDIKPYGVQDENVYLYMKIDLVESTEIWYVVSAGSLNVRSAANTTSDRVGGLEFGDAIKSKAVLDGWVLVSLPDGSVGYVNKSYLLRTYDDVTAIDPVKVTCTGALDVYETIDTASTCIGNYAAGDKIYVTGTRTDGNGNTWLVVDYQGKLGFVMSTNTAGESAIADTESSTLKIANLPSSGADASTVKATVAEGNVANLAESNVIINADGTYEATIYPGDAYSFAELTSDMIDCPEGFMVYSIALAGDGALNIVLGPNVAIEYDVTSGDGQTWTQGSGEDLTFTIARNVGNDVAFNHFLGIQVDNVDVDASNYTAVSGSVIATLKSEYLETLEVGTHTLTVLFDDGDPATSTFTIAGKAAEDSNADPTIPPTGDSNAMLITALLAAALGSLCVLVGCAARRKTFRGKHSR